MQVQLNVQLSTLNFTSLSLDENKNLSPELIKIIFLVCLNRLNSTFKILTYVHKQGFYEFLDRSNLIDFYIPAWGIPRPYRLRLIVIQIRGRLTSEHLVRLIKTGNSAP